jgi:hypothetical protein
MQAGTRTPPQSCFVELFEALTCLMNEINEVYKSVTTFEKA